MRYIHQFDEKGNHRLGSTKYSRTASGEETKVKWGDWAPYSSPAMLGQYLVVTEYFQGSKEFPDPQLLYRVQKDVWPLEIQSPAEAETGTYEA